MSQEKLQTIVMQNFGGLKRCIMGFAQVENAPKWRLHTGLCNRPFPNYLRPLFRSESWCSSFHMEINFHSHANETHFHVNEN